MKFAVGYQMMEDEEQSFADIIMRYKEHIEEVYFSWLNMTSGRASVNIRRGFVDWKAQQKLENDLIRLREQGIKLDILFNANCYGGKAVSKYLANNIYSILEYLKEAVGGVDIVTTTSPAVAHTVKQNFPEIEVRASVNMRIGTVKGMSYLAHLFDSFYVQREYNRDFHKIIELREWAENNNKKLLILANSGCMNFCSGQTFHDNLVAHEAEIDETDNIPDWTPHACWNYYKDMNNWDSILQNSWIRPEDLHHYEKYFPVVKLATRMHSNPEMVIRAYVKRQYHGNILDLFEPAFGALLAPYIIDNSKFPENWFNKTSECDKKCHKCDYCKSVLNKVRVNMNDYM
jgi:collagenase-like PrtC family protease